MLDIILHNATSVPLGIKESAPQMLLTKLEVVTELPDGGIKTHRFQQERGQLMGNLLSFPLLCLVNYLGFRFFSGCKGPVRVNGDDIVFRGTPREAKLWMEGVSRAGLTLSRGKTLVDARYFTLNSSMFKAEAAGKPEAIPMIRSTAFGFRPDCGGVESLAGRFRSFAPHFFGDRRRSLNVRFLQWNRKYIWASGRSLTRGLGMKVDREELSRSNLLRFEEHYLSLDKEEPLPMKQATLEQTRIPPGWSLQTVEKITKEIRERSRLSGPEFVRCAWSPITDITTMEREKDWKRKVWITSNAPPGECSSVKRRAKLLGLSARNVNRLLRVRLQDEDLRRIRSQHRRRVWLPDKEQPAAGANAPRYCQVRFEPETESSELTPSLGRISIPYGWRQNMRMTRSGDNTHRQEEEEVGMVGPLEFSNSKAVAYAEEDCVIFRGSSISLRTYRCGGVGFGPPPTYCSDLLTADT